MPLTVQLDDEKTYEAHLILFYEDTTSRQLKEANIEITPLQTGLPLGYMGRCYTIPLPLESDLIEHSMWARESDPTDEGDGNVWTSRCLRDSDDFMKALLPALRHMDLIDITLKGRDDPR